MVKCYCKMLLQNVVELLCYWWAMRTLPSIRYCFHKVVCIRCFGLSSTICWYKMSLIVVVVVCQTIFTTLYHSVWSSPDMQSSLNGITADNYKILTTATLSGYTYHYFAFLSRCIFNYKVFQKTGDKFWRCNAVIS